MLPLRVRKRSARPATHSTRWARKNFEKASSGAEGAGKKAKKSGDDAKSASEGFNTMTVALGNLIARGIEKLITSLAKLIENTQEARQNMAKLRVDAEEAGESIKPSKILCASSRA